MTKRSKNVSILRFEWNLYFANAWYFESSMLEHISKKEKLKYIILSLELVNNIDYTGQETLENLIERLEKWWTRIYLTNLRTRVIQKLSKSKFIRRFWERYIFVEVEQAVERVKKRFKKADTKALEDYKPDKKKEPEMEEEVLKI